jgi:hypothetical protein
LLPLEFYFRKEDIWKALRTQEEYHAEILEKETEKKKVLELLKKDPESSKKVADGCFFFLFLFFFVLECISYQL